MKFKTALLAMFSVFAIHFVLMVFVGIYSVFPNFDIIAHFAGGFATGMLGLAIHHAVTDKHHFKSSPDWYHYLFVLGFAVLIAVAWEFHEYILDNTLVVWYGWSPTQVSLGDTMLDLLMGALGALSSVFFLKKYL